jgi:phosphoglucomutase
MALISDPDSGLPIGDPDSLPLTINNPGLDEVSVDKALRGMILSASGWRGIFAFDGNGESASEEIGAAHKVIVAAAARVFAAYLKDSGGAADGPLVIVGMDTRPTGRAIADVMIRVLLAEGCTVRFAGITAAPEIMAYARTLPLPEGPPAGFVYISASHNPIGHNGLKFGLTDGGVLAGPESVKLAEGLWRALSAKGCLKEIVETVGRAGSGDREAVYAAAAEMKREAYKAYLEFTRIVASGGQEDLFTAIKHGLAERPLGIAADLNGSARTLSIDTDFIRGLGAKYRVINGVPGKIAHRIVPEGESLEPCREFLEQLHREDPAFVLGYTPDCDGDRGNLVIWDSAAACSRILEAQEVFALACVSELAHLVWTGELSYDGDGKARAKAAIAVNDPTSLRIDRIAEAFGAKVFRAEVGEANVVGLARRLREQGFLVRILGEGSAGGNITHPSAVRDPINTVMALIKLLAIRGEGDREGGLKPDRPPGFFEIWRERSGQPGLYRPDFTLDGIIASLPAFVTTGAYTEDALLQVKTADHVLLKNRYQEIFLREWERRKAVLDEVYGIARWEASTYNGTEESRNIERFGDAGRGGLRIVFFDKDENEKAAIWMRGSGTEPVFRIMADAEGPDARLERDLIEWQRRMVIEADE